MLAAQMVATHNVMMECYRRAMLPDQTFDSWRENLNQANKLGRTYAAQVEALQRYRGKGQQKVTVEHVHVHQGGQAIVGTVERGGGPGEGPENKEIVHAKALAYAPEPALWSPDAEGNAVPRTSNEKRTLQNARRQKHRTKDRRGPRPH
jgi:hypothetical protein